ncbi:putative serine protease PepD [Microbacteriaceae bacterium MWH-Ta3]|nr:putative serine protease PepD [Microbacteriaceae bacterium MWH-Ta3]
MSTEPQNPEIDPFQPAASDAESGEMVTDYTSSEQTPADRPVDEYAVRQPLGSRQVSLKTAAAAAVAFAIIGGVAGGGVAALSGRLGVVAQVPSTVTVNDAAGATATTAVVAAAMNSVVTIEVASSSSGGSGSGVIMSADGYIITNNHVATIGADDADTSIRVTLADGRLYDAEVVGTDAVLDLAVIKIDAEGLTPIEFADSSALNVGDQAIAIGAPLGLAGTVTEGIVSALNRSISISEDDADGFNFDLPDGTTVPISQDLSLPVIQTDASINPGNSGGALLDSQGRLIGINVAIASTSASAGSIGVGFALPSNVVQRIVTDIIESGSAAHGRIGALVTSVSENTGVAGAVITEVEPGSPAALAGLRAGDVVTSFGGVPIRDQVDITAQVRSHAPGDVVDVTIMREGEAMGLRITLGDLGQ